MSFDSVVPAVGGPGDVPDPQVAPKAKSRTFSASYKRKILAEYAGLSKGERSALLRREGLYSSLVGRWRSQAAKATSKPGSSTRPGPKANPEAKEIARLRKENQRLAAELAKSRKIVGVQVKLSALLEELSTSADSQDRSMN